MTYNQDDGAWAQRIQKENFYQNAYIEHFIKNQSNYSVHSQISHKERNLPTRASDDLSFSQS